MTITSGYLFWIVVLIAVYVRRQAGQGVGSDCDQVRHRDGAGGVGGAVSVVADYLVTITDVRGA